VIPQTNNFPQKVSAKYIVVGWDDKVIAEYDTRDEAEIAYFSSPAVARLTTRDDGADIAQKGEPAPCATSEPEKAETIGGSEAVPAVVEAGA
jgi:hypothetical protein